MANAGKQVEKGPRFDIWPVHVAVADEAVGGRMREVAGLGSAVGSGGREMDGGPWVAAGVGSVMRVGSQAGAAATSASCGIATSKAWSVPGKAVVKGV